MSKARAYLELARASNLPTVWSNVLMGFVVGGWAMRLNWLLSLEGDRRPPLVELSMQLRSAWPLMLAGSLYYVGGMVLNDAVDARRDAVDDPGRPIPSGRVSRRAALAIAILLLLAGSAVTWVWASPASLAASGLLVLAIVTYDLLHHRAPASRLLMGVCRGLLVIFAAAWVGPHVNRAWSYWWGVVVPVAAVLTVYTWSISWLAAGESHFGLSRRRLVMGMIAAMPLLDALVLLVLGFWWPAAVVCVLCALLTMLAHRRIAGT